MKNSRDIDFLFEIGSLRNVQRGWRQHMAMDVSNNLEHSFRVVWIAIVLARMEKEKGADIDESKIIRMALVHDLAETRTSDLSYVQKNYVTEDEERAGKDLFFGTSMEDYFSDVLKEYKKRESAEAKIVKDADNLDIDVEMKELVERGSKLSAKSKWQGFRKKVRDEKLYTESARELWDLIQEVDVDDWHMRANKWVTQPEAGK